MPYRQISVQWQTAIAAGMVVSAYVCLPQPPAFAQNITLDGTLGGVPGAAIPVTPGGTLGEIGTSYPNAYLIPETVGQRVEGNLFHSFGRFNLNNQEAAVFLGTGLQNILARVTGPEASLIDGLIQTQSTNVNLFLINPQGIIFGPNAALDVGGATGRGSFIATTTDSLIWGNDPNRRFSASQRNGADTLLTLVGDPSGFLNAQRRPGSIAVIGSGDPDADGLTVFQNKRLLLLGGDVNLDGGVLRALGGRIEIGAIVGAGTVDLDLNTTDVSLQIPDSLARADVRLNRSFVITNSAADDGGDIAIQARNITLSNSTQLQAAAFNIGNAGDVLLTATESVSLESSSIIFSTLEAGGRGKGGNILIRTPLLSMSGGAQLQTVVKTGADGVAGIIFVNTDGGDVVLSGSSATSGLPTLMASSIAEGASNTFSGSDFAGNVFSALLGETNQEITGSVFISTGTLTMSNGARLDSSTFGNSNAGAVVVLANEISLSNRSVISSVVGEAANGNGGGIIIGTDTLSIEGQNTGLTANTFGNGDAGLIFVLASDRITSDGENSGIVSGVAAGVNRAGGGIVLGARSLVLRNRAEVNVNNEGTGSAGEIFISAPAVFLSDGSKISATTRSGQGGNIELNVGVLNLYGSSSIATDADTARLTTGIQPGGNIRILGIPRVFGFSQAIAIAAKPGRDSNIVAKAFKGRGGDIFIASGRLLDIRQRPEVVATNDIDASSEFGVSGTVTFSLIDIDPERGTVQLAENLVDASQLIAEGCDARGKETASRFTNAGRGGLPLSPIEPLAGDAIAADWVETDAAIARQANDRQQSQPEYPAPHTNEFYVSQEIIEAQGWITDTDGNVVLVAQAAAATPHIPWVGPNSCPMP